MSAWTRTGLRHPLAMANLYGYGRLAWNPNLRSETIAEEWTRLSFGNDPLVVQTISKMHAHLVWPIYESYTGPLGAGTLTDILGSHFGPGVESSERNGWGQWHRADHDGIGMDRTAATGTGYVDQYRAPVAKMYESLEYNAGRTAALLSSCPVHLRFALGQDRHPAHLRFALCRGASRGESRQPMEIVTKAASMRSVTRTS